MTAWYPRASADIVRAMHSMHNFLGSYSVAPLFFYKDFSVIYSRIMHKFTYILDSIDESNMYVNLCKNQDGD